MRKQLTGLLTITMIHVLLTHTDIIDFVPSDDFHSQVTLGLIRTPQAVIAVTTGNQVRE